MFRKSIFIALVIPFLIISCSLQQQSATSIISSQTKDVDKIALAIYYDMQTVMENTLDLFLQYKPYMIPSQVSAAQDRIKEMKKLLDSWYVLSGTLRIKSINENSEQFRNLRRQVIFQFVELIEEKN